MQRCCLQASDDLNYILKTDQIYTDYSTRDECMILHHSPLGTTLIKHPQINSNGFRGLAGDEGHPACQCLLQLPALYFIHVICHLLYPTVNASVPCFTSHNYYY